jgi:hypothetical protein
MATLSIEARGTLQNPLDLVEEMAGANDWPFQRTSEQELVVEAGGSWCTYRLYFGWVEEIGAMQFSALCDMRVPEAKREAVYALLALINERLLLGHFDLAGECGQPAFRHAMLLRGARGASVEQLEDLVDIAVSECERFYPAFQFVLWGGRRASEAIDAALLETVGEA